MPKDQRTCEKFIELSIPRSGNWEWIGFDSEIMVEIIRLSGGRCDVECVYMKPYHKQYCKSQNRRKIKRTRFSKCTRKYADISSSVDR